MNLNQQLNALLTDAPGFWQLDACGVTRAEREIPLLLHGAAHAPATGLRLLLLGGLSGKPQDVDLALAALKSYRAHPGLSARIDLRAVPCANPDGLAMNVAPHNGAGGNPGDSLPANRRLLLQSGQPGGAISVALGQLRGARPRARAAGRRQQRLAGLPTLPPAVAAAVCRARRLRLDARQFAAGRAGDRSTQPAASPSRPAPDLRAR